jgi:isocitrate/isopropylmalate dehydrogenase
MLAYLGYAEQARVLEQAVAQTYREGTVLPVDQGGDASTAEFVNAVKARLSAN